MTDQDNDQQPDEQDIAEGVVLESADNLPKLNFNYAKRHGIFVQERRDDKLVVAYVEGVTPYHALIEVRRFLAEPLIFEAVDGLEFESVMAHAYDTGTEHAIQAISDIEEDMDLSDLMDQLPTTTDLLETEDDAPVIRLLNALLTQAIKQVASDIHFETFESEILVRFRIDGVLREVLRPPRVLAPLLTSRLKIMAKLDIAEKRLPQDGRIALRIAGRAVDVRVSTIPTHFGERVVLRLLDKKSTSLDLLSLGMAQKTLDVMNDLIAKPHGIILVTGPTGSGKTTTLYAVLTALNDVSRNILTVEDPIEYYLPGIGQTQVNTKVNMTFAKGLRAILRQDPDVVMVGEIRDVETAEMAVQASLTGHLVLSTLHTNSAIGAVTRLRDMGVEPFLVSSTLIGVAAQRLVRVLCDDCKVPHELTEKQLVKMGLPANEKVTVYSPHGCPLCNNSGYTGRTGIYELIAIDERLGEMIHENESEAAMEAYARKLYPSMRQDGWRRVLAGETSIEEVIRVSASEVELDGSL
ncbi:MAG: type II secretion system ATPase GspE [Coxiellaceae bacterium]|nr:type II secretion system ATPase GspE [Coxiellaceae bacterium]